MLNRIVYCAAACVSLLSGVTHVALVRVDSGVVASVSDEALLGLLAKQPQTPFLYFSRAEYDEATRGLAPKELEEVIRKRLAHWSPEASSQVLDRIYQRERSCLALTAAARQTSTEEAATKVLDQHFAEGLELLTGIVGEGRFDDLDLTSLLMLVVEGEAKLLAELSSSEANSAEVATRRGLAQALAVELRRRGRGEFAQALPYAVVMRGVFISPADRPLKGYLNAMQEHFVEWRNGLVTRLPTHRIADIQKQGKTVAVFYFNGGEFTERAGELTHTQLRREFEERAGEGPERAAQRFGDYLNELRIEQALLRRAARRVALKEKEDAPAAALLANQIAQESALLSSQIVKQGSWLPRDARAPFVQGLRECEEGLLQEAVFFESLLRLRAETDLARRVGVVLQTKRADLARLDPLKQVQ